MNEILDTWLLPTDVGLEFGSGRSTIWLAQRVGHLISVEHDPEWYSIVSGKLCVLGEEVNGKIDYRLCEDGATEERNSFYVNVARNIASGSLDFCLVDGVARDHCALLSLAKLKPGGILIVDNANWYIPRPIRSSSPHSRGVADGFASKVWEKLWEKIQGWRGIWTTNGITDTALWIKPLWQNP